MCAHANLPRHLLIVRRLTSDARLPPSRSSWQRAASAARRAAMLPTSWQLSMKRGRTRTIYTCEEEELWVDIHVRLEGLVHAYLLHSSRPIF